MPSIEVKHQFRGNITNVFEAITDYQKYPDYLQGMNSVKILDPLTPEAKCSVRYEITMIKKFYYTLNMYEVTPGEIRWELEESNIMKQNNGYWKLSGNGDKKVDALYGLDIKFRGLVPSRITDQVAKTNLPIMFEGFQKLIDDVERGKFTTS